MRAGIPFAAAAAAFALAVAPTVQAQQIVHDPRALAQMIEEARTTLDQLRALQTQVEQGRQLFDSLNDLSGVNALAGELGLPTVRNPLPDMRALRAAADGDLSALGDLADRADASMYASARATSTRPPRTPSVWSPSCRRRLNSGAGPICSAAPIPTARRTSMAATARPSSRSAPSASSTTASPTSASTARSARPSRRWRATGSPPSPLPTPARRCRNRTG